MATAQVEQPMLKASEMKKLPSEVIAQLRQYGFVHVTGILYQLYWLCCGTDRIGAKPVDFGKSHRTKNMTVIITVDGQVWWSYSKAVPTKLINQLCPNGKTNFEPLTERNIPDYRSFMRRMAYPYCDMW
jgi:hypothetical protein